MLALIRRGALQAMDPSERNFEAESVDSTLAVSTLELDRLVTESRALEKRLQELSRMRTALSSDLLKVTAVALKILLETRNGDGVTDVKAT